MTQISATIPLCPRPLALTLRTLPLTPISMALTSYARRVAVDHPRLFKRLGPHENDRFILDPTDLPMVICLEPKGGRPKVTVYRKSATGVTRIAGPMAALLGMVHGAYDGDALFFSRDLIVEGDTAAALALRNAVDDAELDLGGEISAMSGPLAAPFQQLLASAERATGLCLNRPEETAEW